MPIHYNIGDFEILEEVRKLEQANKIVRFILPELISHKPGEMFGKIIRYSIIFDDK